MKGGMGGPKEQACWGKMGKVYFIRVRDDKEEEVLGEGVFVREFSGKCVLVAADSFSPLVALGGQAEIAGIAGDALKLDGKRRRRLFGRLTKLFREPHRYPRAGDVAEALAEVLGFSLDEVEIFIPSALRWSWDRVEMIL